MTVPNPTPTKTVVVLGSAYGGIGAAGSLARRLPPDWRVVVIDRNTHANHVYPFPRFTVLPHHAPKAFLPLTQVLSNARITEFQPNVPLQDRTGSPLPPATPNPNSPPATPLNPNSPHRQIHGIITSLSRNSVPFTSNGLGGDADASNHNPNSNPNPNPNPPNPPNHNPPNHPNPNPPNPPSDRVETVHFDYCVYALGGALSEPCDAWGEHERGHAGTKKGGVAFLERRGSVIEAAESVIVVGGGALGIQFATDIKDVHPSKSVTLLHSRTRLMPLYAQGLHDQVIRRCAVLGINVILGERVVEWPTNPGVMDGNPKTITTDKGTRLSADHVLVCTGSRPHSSFMASLDPTTVAENGCIRVNEALQVQGEGLDHMFAIGDCADTTAIRAGHMSFAMGNVAARNIIRLIKGGELEKYIPDAAKIKVTLGITHNCFASEVEVISSENGVEDIGAKGMWAIAGAQGMPDDA